MSTGNTHSMNPTNLDELAAEKDVAAKALKLVAELQREVAFLKQEVEDITHIANDKLAAEHLAKINHPVAAVAAMMFALNNMAEEPFVFMDMWLEGDFDFIKSQWDNVPDAVFATGQTTAEQERDELVRLFVKWWLHPDYDNTDYFNEVMKNCPTAVRVLEGA